MEIGLKNGSMNYEPDKQNTMESTATLPKIFSGGFFKLCLKGAGQVMFQGNAWTGIFFLAGIFYGSYAAGNPAVAWGALAGLFVSTLTGYILRYPAERGLNGLWGFNGILVGCALPTFLGNVPLMWLAVVIFSGMTTWVMYGLTLVLAPYKVSSFTFPFVLTVWFVLLAARIMYALPGSEPEAPLVSGHFAFRLDTGILHLLDYWLRGISQVFLVNSWVTGLLFLIGLACSSRWAAVWAAVASAVALGTAILYQCPAGDIANGLFGFSPVLTGIALGTTFYQVSWRTAVWALLGVFATVFIQAGMDTFFSPFGIPPLTGPFCVTTWLFLLPHLKWDKKILQQG